MADEKYTINFSVYSTPESAISGETLYHVRQVNPHMIKREIDLANKIEANTSFKSSDVKGLIAALRDQIAEYLMQGNSVSIKGLGQFYLQRKEREGRQRETTSQEVFQC